MPDVWLEAARGKSVSQAELQQVARELLSKAGDQKVWLFFGEMGSGKTTLVKAIGAVSGVTEVMSSPTFSIVNEYQATPGKKIYHFDLFRLNNEKEVFDIGTEEYFDSGQLCLVEWPEKLGSLTPPGAFKIKITPTGAEHRKIEYQQA
jgi:tRNA threonylcarbamoyladenosine biosynthesis protein TsaE